MKKYLLPVGAGVVVFGAVTAFAASLTVTSSTLGAGNVSVAACQAAAAVTYAPSGANVGTATVTFSGLPTNGCNTLTAQVTLSGTGTLATTPATGSSTVTAGVANVNFSTVSAKEVTDVAVVVTG